MSEQVYLIPNEAYNKIPNIHWQDVPSSEQILGVGRILVAHGLNGVLGVHLLHRHFIIPSGTIILNSNEGDTVVSQITNISSLDLQKLRGAIFMLADDGTFIPYEYKESGADYLSHTLPSQVSDELTDFLISNNLQHSLAIELLEPDAANHDVFYSECDFHKTGTVQKPVHKRNGTGKLIAWAFRVVESEVVAVERSDCVTKCDGHCGM
jgi:hypothetical protein